jgi:hypothetical protein
VIDKNMIQKNMRYQKNKQGYYKNGEYYYPFNNLAKEFSEI